MPTIFHQDKKAYEKLVKRFPLRPIRNEADNDTAAKVCDDLLDQLKDLSPGERDYLEVLTDLIAKYERRWENDAAKMNARELIEYFMEQNDLTQKDLIPEFGSASRVSKFLSGARTISIEQARKVASRFSLNIGSLLAG